jgi:hypothetical protein
MHISETTPRLSSWRGIHLHEGSSVALEECPKASCSAVQNKVFMGKRVWLTSS